MNRKQSLGLAALLLLILALAGLAWQRSRPRADAEVLVLQGNVDIRQVSLAFEGSDRVLEMRVEEGDHVVPGQVLAVLDTRTARLQLAQAEAQVGVLEQSLLALRNGSRPEEIRRATALSAAARAEFERAQLALARLQRTAASTGGRAVSPQDLDDASAAVRAAAARLESQQQTERLAQIGARPEDVSRAEAQLRAARAERDLLVHRIELAELKAPQAAVVRARLLEPGDMASPQRAAYTLALTEPKWIRAYLSEAQLGRVRPGMAATVTTDSAPGARIEGRVGFISSVAEFTPKTVQTEALRADLVYEVRIVVADPQDRLRLGMPATVRIDPSSAAATGAP